MSTVLPQFDASDFQAGTPIDNPYFPLTPGTVLSYRAETDEGEVQSNDFMVTDATREIEGVTATVVRDTEYLDGLPVEDTFDWHAQDQQGNVWYLGELTFAYEYENGVLTDTEGSWEAGVEVDPEENPGIVASPGFIMPAPEPLQTFLESGEAYYQEFAPGVAEDQASVRSLTETVTVGDATFKNVLQTSESTALEPDVSDFKYYAPGVGNIRVEELADGEVELTVDLQGVRDLNAAACADPGQPEISDLESDAEAMWVTLIASDGDHALGAYVFEGDDSTFSEGRTLFASTEGLVSEEAAVSVPVPDGAGLGLFMVPDGGELAELGIDLSAYEEGGLTFTNPLDFGPASLNDRMAPLVSEGALNFEAPVNLPDFESEEEVLPLPLQVFHAIDADPNGINLLNPAAGVQAIDLDWDGDSEVTVLGFEDTRATDPEFDGDFNDLVLAISQDSLDGATVDQIATDLVIPDDALLG